MAKGRAKCICKVCGKEFVKTANKSSRAEAESWEKWAENQYTLCGSCWFKQKQKKENEAGLKADVKFWSLYDRKEKLYFILYGDTYPIKETLKEIGAKWTDEYPAQQISFSGGPSNPPLVGRNPEHRWVIRTELNSDDITETVENLERLGFSINNLPSEEEVAMKKAENTALEEERKIDN